MRSLIRLSVRLLAVGQCRHCERVTISGGKLYPVAFPSICALIQHPDRGAFLYDTGYANHFTDSTRPFPERLYRWVTPVTLPAEQRLEVQLASFGLTPEDIRGCLISHFHADHVAGLRNIKNARFYALRADVDAIKSGHRLSRLMHGFLPALLPDNFLERLSFADDAVFRTLGSAWSVLGEGFDIFEDGSLLAVPLPGHAPGQMGLRFRDSFDREVFLCADACWSKAAWQELRYPSWLARPVMHCWSSYKQTIQQLHELGSRHPELSIVPSHCAVSLENYHREVTAVQIDQRCAA